MKKIGLYLITITLLCGACEGFLDKYPTGSINQNEAIRNLKDANAAMYGVYATWNSDGLYSGHLTLLPDIQCDFAYSVIGFSNQRGTVYGWNIIAKDEYTYMVYASLYKIISDVNFLLDNSENIELKEGEQAELDNILGEAYFSRALAYSELVKLFCQPYKSGQTDQQAGVSIWDHFVAGKPARSSLSACYTHIFDDLKEANRLLTYDKADAVRITRGALDALYARLYLYMGNWEEAAKAASRVIDNTNYQLAEGYTESVTDPSETDFNRMWEYDKSDEIIWKLEYTVNTLAGSLGLPFCGTTGNQLKVEFAPANAVVELYDENDIRRKVYFKTGNVNGSNMPVIVKYPGNPDLQPTVTQHIYCNMPKVFRLAEMYLIRAEAYACNNEANLANQDLKTLRAKRIRGYEHQTLNGNLLLQEIRKERIRELYMEGHRLYDLKRYGEGFTRKSQPQSISPEDRLNITPTHHNFIWPIPSHEMDANRNMTQNPGY